MTKFIAFLLFLTSFASLMAQESILERFTISQSQGKVLLTWIIEEGSTCNGIDILRSTDSLNFTEIGHIEGICGDEEKSVTYKHVDENPTGNATNFYRLKLGSVGTSDIVSIDIITIGENGYTIRPNPFSFESHIYLNNENGDVHELKVYNLEGRLTLKKQSQINVFELKREHMSPGMYLFTIENLNNESLFKGKIVVTN